MREYSPRYRMMQQQHLGQIFGTIKAFYTPSGVRPSYLSVRGSTSQKTKKTKQDRKNSNSKTSSVGNQPPRHQLAAPKLIVQHVKIQIDESVLGHEIRDAPDRGAPFRPRDRVPHPARVQDQPDHGGSAGELAGSDGRLRGRVVPVDVVGGDEEALEDVADGDRGAEVLEFDGDGGVWDTVEEWFRRERSSGLGLSLSFWGTGWFGWGRGGENLFLEVG